MGTIDVEQLVEQDHPVRAIRAMVNQQLFYMHMRAAELLQSV